MTPKQGRESFHGVFEGVVEVGILGGHGGFAGCGRRVQVWGDYSTGVSVGEGRVGCKRGEMMTRAQRVEGVLQGK